MRRWRNSARGWGRVRVGGAAAAQRPAARAGFVYARRAAGAAGALGARCTSPRAAHWPRIMADSCCMSGACIGSAPAPSPAQPYSASAEGAGAGAALLGPAVTRGEAKSRTALPASSSPLLSSAASSSCCSCCCCVSSWPALPAASAEPGAPPSLPQPRRWGVRSSSGTGSCSVGEGGTF